MVSQCFAIAVLSCQMQYSSVYMLSIEILRFLTELTSILPQI